MADQTTATLKYHEKQWQVPSGKTIRDAIVEAGLDPQAVLAIREKRLVNHQTILGPQDQILLVNVVSGG